VWGPSCTCPHDTGSSAYCVMTDWHDPGSSCMWGEAHQLCLMCALFDVLLCLGINRTSRKVILLANDRKGTMKVKRPLT